VNEIQLIRAQLGTECLHTSAVASACAAAGSDAADLRAAGADYLRHVLGSFQARDQRLGELLRARPGLVDEGERRGLEAALAQPGGSDEVLGKLTATINWQALAQFIGTAWGGRRDAIDALMTTLTRPADWRAIAGIDADSILEERRRFERACAASAPDAPLPGSVAAQEEAQC
jgi:hypothetical protein